MGGSYAFYGEPSSAIGPRTMASDNVTKECWPPWTAGSAERKRSTGRPLLHRRSIAKLKLRLRLQLDERRGSRQNERDAF